MADNIQIPKDVTKVLEVKDRSEPLRKLLIDILTRLNTLEKKTSEL